jgi:predicted phage terminase large subunit-like protein
MINKTTEMLELSFALGTAGGKRRFIGTRYHFNDSYAVLMMRETVKPRIYAATEDGSATGKPVLLTEEDLILKRRDMGEYTFSCQMLQNPVADETQGFKREWIKHYDRLNPNMLNKYILVDSANSKKSNGDYTAVWVIGLGPDKNYYVLDIIRDRLNLTQRANLVIDLHRKWKPHRKGVRYERYGLMGDIDHIKTEQERQCYRFEVVEVGGNIKKEDRIRRLIPLFEAGTFYFPRSLYYTGSDGKTKDMVKVFIEEEFRAFPVPVHDDLLDSLARICEPDHPLFWPRDSKMELGGQEKIGKVNQEIKVW